MTATLRGGYTLADLDRMAHAAVRSAGSMAYDARDRYDEARSTIAEALYSIDEPPDERDLVRVGREAIWGMTAETKHHHGWFQRTAGWGDSPAFQRFWRPVGGSSVEERVVERLALAQIMPTLSRRQRDVVAALAAFDDHGAAKVAFGGQSFSTHLARARRAFLAAWHEGEAPSKPWGSDRRCGGRTGTAIVRRRRREATKAA